MFSLQQTLLMYTKIPLTLTPQNKGINCIQGLYLNIIINSYKQKMKNIQDNLKNDSPLQSISSPLTPDTCSISNITQKQSIVEQQKQSDVFQEKNTQSPTSSDKLQTNYLNCVIEPTDKQGGIFISDFDYASNLQNLYDNNIATVLSIDRNHNFKLPDSIQHMTIIAFDNEMESIKVHFDKTYQFILNAIQNKQNILIHCRRGISRSATIIIAFLMKFYSQSYQESHEYLQSKRPIIKPNCGFVKQLKAYEIVLKEYQLYTKNCK